MKKACIIFTTIFDPLVLEAYYENFQRFGHLDQVEFIVIPDRKTPEIAYARCREMTQRGMRTVCPTLPEQESFLKSVGLDPEFILYNSDHRRNVGYLMALGSDCDFYISLDDDNYARADEDAFQEHSIVAGPVARHEVVESASGYYNIVDLLECENGQTGVHPRGYPFSARHPKADVSTTSVEGAICLNAGLWLLDPDVEALTWLVQDPHVKSFRGQSPILGLKTWSPVNTQNTALSREAMVAYYFIRMGYPIAGMAIDRYGDIFSGYFVQACMKHLGGLLRVGSPVAEHRRNTHNYMRDATAEWGAILVLEELLPWLRDAKLSGSTWAEAYRSLAAGLEEFAESWVPSGKAAAWTESARGFLRQTAGDMRTWTGACETILGRMRS
jgi:hypothetical protein